MTIFNVNFKTRDKVIAINLLWSNLKIFYKILSKHQDNRRCNLYVFQTVKEAILNFPFPGKYWGLTLYSLCQHYYNIPCSGDFNKESVQHRTVGQEIWVCSSDSTTDYSWWTWQSNPWDTSTILNRDAISEQEVACVATLTGTRSK